MYPIARSISTSSAALSPWNAIDPFSASAPPEPRIFLNFFNKALASSAAPTSRPSTTVTVLPFVPLFVTPTVTLCIPGSRPREAPVPEPIEPGFFAAPAGGFRAAPRSAFMDPVFEENAATTSASLMRTMSFPDPAPPRSAASSGLLGNVLRSFISSEDANGFAPSLDFLPPPPFAPARVVVGARVRSRRWPPRNAARWDRIADATRGLARLMTCGASMDAASVQTAGDMARSVGGATRSGVTVLASISCISEEREKVTCFLILLV